MEKSGRFVNCITDFKRGGEVDVLYNFDVKPPKLSGILHDLAIEAQSHYGCCPRQCALSFSVYCQW